MSTIEPGQFVVGSFATSDNTCAHCQYGYQSSCVHREFLSGAQAPLFRVPQADGTLVATADVPPDRLIPSLLTASDVLGTGWFAAEAAHVKPGATVAVVGDGAVGLLGVLSAKQMGAERIMAMSRHPTRQTLAGAFGATDIIAERGDEGVARIKEITKGVGADSVLECVGTQESMMQAIHATRPGGAVGFVAVPHGVAIEGEPFFYSHVRLHGGPAPVREIVAILVRAYGADPVRSACDIGNGSPPNHLPHDDVDRRTSISTTLDTHRPPASMRRCWTSIMTRQGRDVAVAIDPHGKLHYGQDHAAGDHVIAVLGTQLPDAYQVVAVNPDGSGMQAIVPPEAGYVPNDLVFDARAVSIFADFRSIAPFLVCTSRSPTPEKKT